MEHYSPAGFTGSVTLENNLCNIFIIGINNRENEETSLLFIFLTRPM